MMPSAGRDGWWGTFSVLVLHNILGVKACSVNSNVAIDGDNDTHRINNIVQNTTSYRLSLRRHACTYLCTT